MIDIYINRWGSLCSIVAFLFSTAAFLQGLLQPTRGTQDAFHGLAKLQTILFLGVAAAAAHGILWAIAERVSGSHFGAGGSSLPQGGSALALSATMTVPLVCFPPVYARITQIPLVSSNHKLAAGFVLVVSAAAHIFIYGARSLQFKGVRNLIFPLHSGQGLRRALLMESVYAATHFSSIVLVYRLIARAEDGPLRAIYYTLIAAGVWFFCDCASIFLNYPGSIKEERLIEVRGIINGLMLTITLEGGMLT